MPYQLMAKLGRPDYSSYRYIILIGNTYYFSSYHTYDASSQKELFKYAKPLTSIDLTTWKINGYVTDQVGIKWFIC